MKRIVFGLLLLCLLLHVEIDRVSADQPIQIPAEQARVDADRDTTYVNTTAPAQTFTVLRTDNIQDGNIGDGVCATGPTNAGSCTLFAAIQESNHTSARDTINFNIPGAGPHVFNVNSGDDLGLPEITRPVTINGISQSGANCPNILNMADLRIVLDGGGDQAHGLRLGESADASLIKGLVIINFTTSGIEFNGADNVEIECNHIGVAANGTTAGSNGIGIRVDGFSNGTVIGGTSSINRAERNVISGNSGSGIFNQNGSDSTIIRGNFIGTNALGAAALPNSFGIWTRSQNAEIGGAQSYHANVISGNSSAGLRIGIYTQDLLIDGNLIGTDAIGLFAVPNANGIRIDPNDSGGGDPAPQQVTIGLLAANSIANNNENGIYISGDNDGGGEVSQVQWRTNRIYNNGQIGIDLGNNSVDSNDIGDGDVGPNGYQNWPVLLSAENSGRIRGALTTQQSASLRTYAIDVYQSSVCDPSGNGEGATYLDTFFMSGDGDIEPFDEFIDPQPATGAFLALIATDPAGNSSEFGNCIVVGRTTFVVDEANGGINSDDINPGDGRCLTNGNDCTLRAAIMEVNALGGDQPYNIYFDLGLTGLMSLSSSAAIPTITVPVNIDGIADNPDTRCPTSASDIATLRVTVRGFGLSAGSDSIVLGAGSDGSTIRGIAFTESRDSALHIASDDNVVTCSWFGYGSITSWDGANHRAIDVVGDDNVIGGDTHAERNVIAKSAIEGIRITASGTGNVIEGNYIGTNKTANAADGNLYGIYVANATGNTIGGKLSSSANVISGNTSHGIWFTNSANSNVIAGNLIGLDRTGSADLGNAGSGIRIDTSLATVIGSTEAESANIISGNNQHGIWLSDTEDTVIMGNIIGLDRAAGGAVGNTLTGIRDDRGQDNIIGGATAAAGNIIGSNGRNGVYLLGNTIFPTVQNNLIGLTSSSRATFGNGFYGIHIDAESGFATTQATIADNTIAFNLRDGVRVDSAAAFTHLSANSIYENSLLGIDLNEDGANSPAVGVEITTADGDIGKLIAKVDALNNNAYRVDFFRSDACDPSGYGEGQTYLGSNTVTTNCSGDGEATLASPGFSGGDAVTATLTRLSPAPATSEFSRCFTATGTLPTAVQVSGQATVTRAWFAMTMLAFGILSLCSVGVFYRTQQPMT